MTVKELIEELKYYDDDMDIEFNVCDTFEPEHVTEDKWGNREVYLNAKVKIWSVDEGYKDVCIHLVRVR